MSVRILIGKMPTWGALINSCGNDSSYPCPWEWVHLSSPDLWGPPSFRTAERARLRASPGPWGLPAMAGRLESLRNQWCGFQLPISCFPAVQPRTAHLFCRSRFSRAPATRSVLILRQFYLLFPSLSQKSRGPGVFPDWKTSSPTTLICWDAHILGLSAGQPPHLAKIKGCGVLKRSRKEALWGSASRWQAGQPA